MVERLARSGSCTGLDAIDPHGPSIDHQHRGWVQAALRPRCLVPCACASNSAVELVASRPMPCPVPIFSGLSTPLESPKADYRTMAPASSRHVVRPRCQIRPYVPHLDPRDVGTCIRPVSSVPGPVGRDRLVRPRALGRLGLGHMGGFLCAGLTVRLGLPLCPSPRESDRCLAPRAAF